MKERPILYSAPMVLAKLRGIKTQTRRLVKRQPSPEITHPGTLVNSKGEWQFCWMKGPGKDIDDDEIVGDFFRCPYGVPGDRLWGKETWAYWGGNEYLYQREPGAVQYRATHHSDLRASDYCRMMGKPDGDDGWRPSIFMPRWASRILDDIVHIRLERLHDISEEDAIAEGARGPQPHYAGGEISEIGPNTFRDGYRELWEEINGAGSWDANPWVWVIETKKAANAQERAA